VLNKARYNIVANEGLLYLFTAQSVDSRTFRHLQPPSSGLKNILNKKPEEAADKIGTMMVAIFPSETLGSLRTIRHHNPKTSAHPNDILLTLLELPEHKRLRRHLPNDLPTRFMVQFM
jgi:hypothetical protein